MVNVLKRYRAIFIVFFLIMLAAIVFTMMFKQNSHKVPMRGVFVMEHGANYGAAGEYLIYG